MIRIFIALILTLFCVSAAAQKTKKEKQVCFSESEFKKLELMKINLKKCKQQTKALKKYIEAIKAIQDKSSIKREEILISQKPCRCVLPWSLLAGSVGGCAGLVVGLELRR